MQCTVTLADAARCVSDAARKGNAAALRSMTELSINAFIAGGQMLLDEQERAFIATCDTVCMITETAGWPNIRVLDPRTAMLELVSSQALHLRLDQPLGADTTKVALLLIRHSDGQHLIIHGHIASRSSQDDEGSRVRISVASRTWLPQSGGGGFDPSISRALSFR